MIEIQKRTNDLINLLTVISGLVVETDIIFNKEGIYIRAVHPSNHCMIMINISPEFFETYEIEKDEVYTLNVEQLSTLIKILKKGKIKFSTSGNTFDLENEVSKFQLNYFVGNKDKRNKPNFDQTNELIINASEFFNCITDLTLIDSIGTLQIKDNKFYILSKSHLIKGSTNLDCTTIKQDEQPSYYDLTYINNIEKIRQLFDNITIKFSSQTPLTISGKNKDIDFEFILAGRMEDE